MKRKYTNSFIYNFIIIIIAFIFLLIGMYFASWRILKLDSYNTGMRTINSIEKEINQFFVEIVDIVNMASTTVEYLEDNNASTEDIQNFLVYMTNEYTADTSAAYLGIYGIINGEYVDGSEWRPSMDYEIENSPWYLAAIDEEGDLAVTNPYIDPKTGKYLISLSALLKNNIDIISMDVSLSFFENEVEVISQSGVGECVIINPNGQVIASTDSESISVNLLSDHRNTDLHKIAKRAITSNAEYFYTRYKDKRYMILNKQLENKYRVILLVNEYNLFIEMMPQVFGAYFAAIFLMISILVLYRYNYLKHIQSEIVNTQLKSAASIYISMYSIDLIDNKLKELKSMKHITSGITDDDADEKLQSIMASFTDEQYRKRVLEFIDFNNIKENLKNRNTCTVEFLSNRSKWCRGRFIAENYDNNNNLIRVLWVVENIDEEKRKSNHLLYLSETDLLTSLRNRGSGEQSIREMLQNRTPGMFCLMDIDKFKGFNDTYGHAIGDKVIISVANCLKNSFRDSDIVMRLGGDEFAVYAVGIIDKNAAIKLINRFFDEINSIDIPEITDRKVSLSIGISFYDAKEDLDFDTLYVNADNCTYKSKQIIGNSYTFFE
ncbi:MAG: diguanylate cyclase [Butyrivibrio sp.]|nr:diguanylate cyclase [Butyrivibrio sp.]